MTRRSAIRSLSVVLLLPIISCPVTAQNSWPPLPERLECTVAHFLQYGGPLEARMLRFEPFRAVATVCPAVDASSCGPLVEFEPTRYSTATWRLSPMLAYQ